ncbi:hypothetical protein KGF57_003932 [Candida theae]|uniref:Glutamine amidotransferase type-2 domain-containing protein n=1 Tax=Candida theae TaxID=1198502 RepID=A0AAD5BCH1_9ASCO|nr:uncharacterized protein KGF57_003932 [Candida theae]KAI5953723.1 hypothetical protein KGF57_003932 [Candida theae]
MCGILLRVSSSSCHSPKGIELTDSKGDICCRKWEATDQQTIELFLQEGSLVDDLTHQQRAKVENLDVLRLLVGQLSKVKNNVKIDALEKEQQIQAIENQISIIGKEDDVPMRSFDFDRMMSIVANRGPNYLNFTQFESGSKHIQLFTSILSLRQPFTKQPVCRDEFVLQFNGELYNEECLDGNDTQFIMDKLHSRLGSSRRETILSTLRQLKGEWAITVIDLVESKVYFGRDSIGKRSLCYRVDKDELVVSSNSALGFKECRNEIYVYDLGSEEIEMYRLLELPNFHNLEVKEEDVLHELNLRLKEAVTIRNNTIHPVENPNDTSLAVLFSGGLDCTILARFLCEITRSSIDLLTVGFENPRTGQTPDTSPDRKLATKSWLHLCKTFPHLTINLVEIDVDYQHWLRHKNRVRELMYPCNTEMDLSIAIAFYFAASNLPHLASMRRLTKLDIDWETYIQNPSAYSELKPNYVSSTKVLFSGLGADELFAGYSRHEGLFNRITSASYTELQESLAYDIRVIHERNLGRDDRVMSCWGKELRYPYLDESFIKWVFSNVPPQLKFKYEIGKNKRGKEQIIPTRKYILRQLAELLGMSWVSQELKRAIQFGAKSAKLELGQNKAKGTDTL